MKRKNEKSCTLVGSPCWMAPEVMSQSGHNVTADIWSLGITMLELALGEAPYSNRDTAKVMCAILNGDPPHLPNIDGFWDKRFEKLINSCLQKNPEKRPSIAQLLATNSSWFSKAKDCSYLRDNFLQDLP